MTADRLFAALAGLAVAQTGWVSSAQAQGTPPDSAATLDPYADAAKVI
jgi:hypothetical protein